VLTDWWLGAMERLVGATCSHPLGDQLVKGLDKHVPYHHPAFFLFFNNAVNNFSKV
jgi:hypothetical protein